MVSFNTLAVCLSALISVCSAHGGHAHLHRRSYLQARAGYNGTETTLLPIATGAVAVPPPAGYTATVTQTNTKLVTVTYTLGNGAVKTTTITKAEETVQTIAHVKSTVTVAPIIESTAAPAIIESTSVPAFIPIASAVSSAEPKSTSTTTLVITIDSSETTTAIIGVDVEAITSSAVCSVQTIYIPQYVTLYSTVVSTVTVSAAQSAVQTSITPPYSNNTIGSSTISYESTSTTTLSVYTTVYVKPSAV